MDCRATRTRPLPGPRRPNGKLDGVRIPARGGSESMTQSLDISSGASAAGALLIRTLLSLIILTALFIAIRQAIVVFTGVRSQQLGRKKYWYFGSNLLAIFILLLT